MADLTDEAKAEIKAAIQIVREDRFEKFVREHTAKTTPPVVDPPKNDPPTPPITPPTPPPTPPIPPGPTPPPPTPPVPPVTEKRKSLWWGEED